MFFDWTRKFGIKGKFRNARAYRTIETTEEAGEGATSQTSTLIMHQKDTDVFKAGGVASFMNEYGIILSFVSFFCAKLLTDIPSSFSWRRNLTRRSSPSSKV
jgi:hypothetical protein